MHPLLHFSFLILLIGALLAWPGAPPTAPAALFPSPVPIGTSVHMQVTTPETIGGEPGLWVRARTAHDRLRTWRERSEREAALAEMEAAVAALARRQDASRLPWEAWILETRSTRPELADALFRGACRALGPAVLPLAREVDSPVAPDALRVSILDALWTLQPMEGSNHTRKVLFRETPRAQDHLRPAVVQRLAGLHGPVTDAEVDDILARVVGDEGQSERVRRLAVEALYERGARDKAANVASAWLDQGQSQLLRRRALVVALELDPRLAQQLLDDVPDADVDPIAYDLVRGLRDRYGLVSLPAR